MMAAAAFRRFAFGYGAAFGVLYVVSRARGLALFTVYPTLGIVLPGMHRSRDVADPVLDFLAPEMWWIRLDRHGRDRSPRIRPYSSVVAGSMVAPVLAGMVVGDSGLSR